MTNTYYKTCRICLSGNENSVFFVKEMLFGTGTTFEYFQCRTCGCLQISEFPKDLSEYYPQDYYSYSDFSNISISKFDRFRYSLDFRARHWPIVSTALKQLRKIVTPSKHLEWAIGADVSFDSSILDVGCGHGKVLLKMNRSGFERCLGIDPFIDEDLEYPGGVKIRKMDLAEFSRISDEKFDLIMFNHSLEHMQDPVSMIKTAKNLLKPDGKILVRLPLADSFFWEHYREHWFGIDAPRHFYLMTKQSMKILADKADLCIQRIDYDTTRSHFIESELYRQGIPGNAQAADKDRFTKQQRRNFKKRADLLDKEQRGGQAGFYLALRQNS